MNKPNPYNYNLPVQENMFYGRHKDLDDITERLVMSPGDSVAIVGGRRIGKTSFLEAIQRSLEKLQASDRADTVFPIPIFIKLSGEISESPTSFFSHIGEETLVVLENRFGDGLLSFAGISEDSPPAPAIRRFLIECSKLLTNQVGRRFRLIVLLDECEQIVEQPWAAKLYDALHYLLSGQSTRSLIKVVMAGSHRFLTEVRQYGSPLRDVLHYHRLQVLDKDAIESLINEPTSSSLPKELVEIIEDATGGHPYLIQYIMYNLWDLNFTNFTIIDVERIISDFPFARSNFTDWVNDLYESSLEIFYILSKAENTLDEREIRRTLINIPADLLQAIDALRYHGLITRDGNGNYRVSGQMFLEWFNTSISNRFQKSYSDHIQKKDITMEEDLFDVFLSHSHSDAVLVETLAKRLEDIEGVKVWLDKWILVPGKSWIQEMARGISQAKACAVFLGQNTPKGWFEQEIERALNRQARDKNFRVIPVLLPGTDERIVDNFLELRTWVDFRNGADDNNAFRRLVAGIKGISPGRDLM